MLCTLVTRLACLAGLAGLALEVAPAWAQPTVAAVAPAAPAAPASAALAPAPGMPYNAAVAARFPAPAVRHDLPSLAPDATAFTSNEALAGRLAALAAAAPAGTRVQRLQPGRSQDGQPIEALRFSRGALPRPAVLLIGQQHGDEPAGAEALLVLAGQLLDGALASVLDRIDVVLLPRANPDGAEWQRRVNAAGMDINRDHLLLRTPEAQAVAALVRSQRPVVVVDAHEHAVVGRYLQKFKAIQRNDLLLQYAMTANLPEALGRASEAWFRQPILAALAAEGHSTEWYYTNPTTAGDLRLVMGGVQPDTGRNVNGLRHAVSILLESRGAGLGHLHLARRVQSQLLAMATVLRQAALHADDLQALQAAADAEVQAAACTGQAVVLAQGTPTRRTLLMLDPDTGADKPVDVAWESALPLKVLIERSRPCGYWLAASQTAAVTKLRALGVAVQRIASPATLQTEAWEETARGEVDRPDVRGIVSDGYRTILRLAVALRAESADAPAGSWYVPLDQPLANLVIAALEPDSQNSFVANRVIDRLDAARRVTARPTLRLVPD